MANEPADISVQSKLFSDGETIPKSAAHSYVGGDNISPDLQWTEGPAGTQSYAVTCYDPDAPTTVGFTHWILFDIDPSVTSLEAGAGADGNNPPGSVHGFVDWGGSEYGGMAPPEGDPPHHYHFTVYALDTKLGLPPTATYAFLNFNMRGHILAQGTITGLYSV